MRLELLTAYPNPPMRIKNMVEGLLCYSRSLYDKIEQLPPYFDCALSNFWDILNAQRATLGASLILLEQQKNRIHADVALGVFWMWIEQI